MKKRHYKYILFVLPDFVQAFTAFIVFIFNPLGLGPEPDRVLSESFFSTRLKT